MNQRYTAFTFVELIIVVTILVILSTIGFISYNGYIVGVRDTSRINQLSNLNNALNSYSIKNILPLPEESVQIKNGTEIIAYQGYLGKNIIESIGYSTQGFDPKDKQYYSYYLTGDRRYFQLLGFLEEEKSILGLKLIDKVHANINRYPYTQGSRLGILTDVNNIPVQEVEAIRTAGELDISNVGSLELKSFLSANEFISGSGTSFSDLKNISRVGGKKWNIENNGFIYGGEVEFTGSSSGGGVVVNCNTGETVVSGQCSDPHWSNVSLLLHMEGNNNSTNFIDEKGHLFTSVGGLISTSKSKFGSGSALFSGNNSINSPSSSDWNFGTGDFTIEFWVNFNVVNPASGIYSPGNQYMFDIGSNGTFFRWYQPEGLITFNGISTPIVSNGPYTPSINNWYFLSLVRSGNTIKLFINGTLQATNNSYTGSYGSNNQLTIGNYGGGGNYGLNGNIDELRITKGVARYSENFTPPLYSFPNQ